jgi:hypothetical protein
MRGQLAIDVKMIANVMGKGHAADLAGAKEHQDHQRAQIITMMNPKLETNALKIQVTEIGPTEIIIVMEEGPVVQMDGVKENLDDLLNFKIYLIAKIYF